MSPFNGRRSLELNGDIVKTIDKEGENHFLEERIQNEQKSKKSTYLCYQSEFF